jgi:hypothetical protein
MTSTIREDALGLRAALHDALREASKLIAEHRKERELDTRSVYFIQAENGLIKIGIADNVEQRLVQLQTMSPLSLKIVGVIPGAGSTGEAALHERFGIQRSHGEWFRPSPELLSMLDANWSPSLTDSYSRPRKTNLPEKVIAILDRARHFSARLLGFESWVEFIAKTGMRVLTVSRLRSIGLSGRAIGVMLNIDESTVRLDLKRVPVRLADDYTINGLDGKVYPNRKDA